MVIFSEAVKRSFFVFFSFFLSFHYPPQKNTTYLPTMKAQGYEKQVFLYGRHRGMLSGVAFGATEGANKGWFSEYRPYVAVRGGWLFGKAEPGLSLSVPPYKHEEEP